MHSISSPLHSTAPHTYTHPTHTTANFVVKEIQKMEAAGTLTPHSTVALIYRTNAQSRSLEEACVSHNLRYLVRGSAGTFYSCTEVKDCLCFLRLLCNGSDRAAFARAVGTPARGIGGVSLIEFWAYCEGGTVDVVLHVPKTPCWTSSSPSPK